MREELTWQHRKNTLLNSRLSGWWGSPRRVVLSVLVAFIFLLITLSHYHEFQGKGTPPTLKVNTLCNDYCDDNGNNGKNGSVAYCELPKQYQFEKIIWFITDGYPLYMQREWLPLYAEHAIPFAVAVPGKKWSHAVYTSWFTGMPNVNVLARPIEGDTIFESMRRSSGLHCSLHPSKNGKPSANASSFDLHWVGPTWCPIELLGGAEKAKKELNFVDIDTTVEDLEIDPLPYPSINDLPTLLQQVASKGQSLITHTGLIDKAAHYDYPTELLEDRLFGLFAYSGLKEFIDSHPEYLLIMSSDHGQSRKGKFHGDGNLKKSENIGTFVFYNPVFQGQNLTEIDVVDVLPTMSKYLKNVDIPYYSVGEVRNSYGPGNERYVINALKQNLAQLKEVMIDHAKEVDFDRIEGLLNSNDEEGLRNAVREIKALLFRPVSRPFYEYTIYILAALVLGCVVYWTRIVNNEAIYTTFALAAPLVISFGFFMKPLDFYVFHTALSSNFTFYFGITTSAILACVFSGWRGTGYVFMNEILNIVGYIARVALDGTQPFLVSLFSIALSLFESNHHISQQSSQQPRSSTNQHRFMLIFLHFCNFMYLFTANVKIAYVDGINVFALAIYFSFPAAFVWLMVKCGRARRSETDTQVSIEPLVISLTSVLLVLFEGSPLVVLFNFQARQILPCLFAKSQFGKTRGKYGSYYAIQASAVYAIQQAVWISWFVWGQAIDMEFDVRGGVAGIKSWNDYPIFAGILLGAKKAGIFPLAALHIGAVIIPNLFPLFIYFMATIINFLSIHMCFKKFTFKTPIETLLVITILMWMQFLILVIVKFSGRPNFAERAPLGYNLLNYMGKLKTRLCIAARELKQRRRGGYRPL